MLIADRPDLDGYRVRDAHDLPSSASLVEAPPCITENRVGVFALAYDDARRIGTCEQLATRVHVVERIKDSGAAVIWYRAYSDQFGAVDPGAPVPRYTLTIDSAWDATRGEYVRSFGFSPTHTYVVDG